MSEGNVVGFSNPEGVEDPLTELLRVAAKRLQEIIQSVDTAQMRPHNNQVVILTPEMSGHPRPRPISCRQPYDLE